MKVDEDPEHYRYMISVGSAAIIAGLREDELGWTYGGPVRIRKSRPFFDDGPVVRPLHPGTRFYKVPFSTPLPGDATKEVHGLALWFEKVPMDPPRMGESITLCGWVPAVREHEIDEWIAFLNAQITERLKEAPVSSSDRHINASLAGFEALGLTMPKGHTVDEVMDELKDGATEPRRK